VPWPPRRRTSTALVQAASRSPGAVSSDYLHFLRRRTVDGSLDGAIQAHRVAAGRRRDATGCREPLQAARRAASPHRGAAVGRGGGLALVVGAAFAGGNRWTPIDVAAGRATQYPTVEYVASLSDWAGAAGLAVGDTLVEMAGEDLQSVGQLGFHARLREAGAR